MQECRDENVLETIRILIGIELPVVGLINFWKD